MWHIPPLYESSRRMSCKAGYAKYNWFTFLGNDTAKTTSIFRVEVRESEKFDHQCRPSLEKENFTYIVASIKFCCQNEVFIFKFLKKSLSKESWMKFFRNLVLAMCPEL